MARIAFVDHRAPAAAEAYDIALDYLERSGSVRDPDAASIFLAEELFALVERGEHNKIRLANLAIISFEKRYHVEH
jgi:sulfur relay (sulfurtransferase) DsrF/TusC family protein